MSNFPKQQNEAALHAADYWQIIKNRYGIILMAVILCFMTAAVITYVMPKKYESAAEIQLKPTTGGISPFGGQMAEASGANRTTAQFFANELEKIKSTNALNKVVDSLELANKWSVDKSTAVQILKGIVDANLKRGTDVITIRVKYKDKQDACDVATEVVKAYQNYRKDIENSDAEKALSELNKAVREQEDKLEDKRKALAKIQQTQRFIYTGPNSIYGQSASNEDLSARSDQEAYVKLNQSQVELESQIKSLTNYNAEQLLAYASGLDLPDNTIKLLLPQYEDAKRQLESLKISGLGNRHVTVLAAKEQIANMDEQLQKGVVTLRGTLQAKLGLVNDQLKKFEALKDSSRDEAIKRGLGAQDYVNAKMEFEAEQELLTAMKMKFMGESISKKMTNESVVVNSPAEVARAQSSPKVALNLIIGAVAGLIFGLVIAFCLEHLDTSVKSLEDVERYLQVPVLAVIPKDVGVLHKQNGTSPDAEAYRILRTNIEFNRKNPEDNAITVVSGGAGEGKSTTLVNLAYICAQGGYTTLMIDADLRRPRLHTFFDINNSVGLTNYLTTELVLEDVILQTPVDNLYFMPSGILPSDAAGILNSRRMSELIQDVKQRFDLVLVDSPPILGVSDASVLASEVDLTMIVVQHRKLPRNMLMRVKQAVENVGGNVIGVVLNNVDVRSDSQYQYYTSYYTYYAPSDGQVTPVGSASSKASAVKSKTDSRNSETDLY